MDKIQSIKPLDHAVAVRHNGLTEARFHLSHMEHRIILCAISQLDSMTLNNQRSYTIQRKEFQELFKVKLNSRAMQNVCSSLMSRVLRIKSDEKRGILIHWVSSIQYNENGVCVTLSREIMPYLEGLKTQFSKVSLNAISKMTSTYGYRIYDFINQYRALGQRKVTLLELRNMLELESRYPLFKEFNRCVLMKAIDQINNYTDLYVEMSFIKKGRSVESIVFNFKAVNKPSLTQSNPTSFQDDLAPIKTNVKTDLDHRIDRLKQDIKTSVVDVIVRGNIVDKERSIKTLDDGVIKFTNGGSIELSELY